MNRAEQIVRETLASSLPPGSPLMFRSIERAAFDGKHSIVAQVTMFDGQPAVARLNAWSMGWSIGWDDLPGGAASLEDGAWRRVAASCCSVTAFTPPKRTPSYQTRVKLLAKQQDSKLSQSRKKGKP